MEKQKIKFFKLNALPVSWEANAFYFITLSEKVEIYITDKAGVHKNIGNSTFIIEVINRILDKYNLIEIFADEDAMRATTYNKNTLVYVTSSDKSSLFVYNTLDSNFTKLLDITGVEEAIKDKHTHSNREVLDKILLKEDVLSYDDKPILSWSQNEW